MPMLAFVLLVALPGGTAPSPRVTDLRQRTAALEECVTVQVGLPGGRRILARRPVLSAREVAEVEFLARGQTPMGGRHLELRLFLPDGHLYQKLGARDTAAGGSTRRRRLPAGTIATARLPLAETAITMSSLYGTWAVVPYVDGRPAACAASRFVIRP